MGTSNMLLIVPPDWIELDLAHILTAGGYDLAYIQFTLVDLHLGELVQLLEGENVNRPVPVGQMITEGKIFDDGTGPRLWVKFGPEI